MTETTAIPTAPPRTPRYLVGVLYYGNHDTEHDRCMHKIYQHPNVAEIKELGGCAYIDIGRSLLATLTLDSEKYDGLLMIDHDIVFEPEAVSMVIESAERLQGVVGGPYSMRSPGASIIGAVDTESLAPDEEVVFFEGGKLYPAVYLGMGFTAIPRSALLTLTKTMARVQTGVFPQTIYPLFALMMRDLKWFGEDISFCNRAHDARVPVGIDTRIRLHHRGTYDYGIEDCGTIVPYMKSVRGIIKEHPQLLNASHAPDPQVAAALAARETAAVVIEPAAPETEWPRTLPLDAILEGAP